MSFWFDFVGSEIQRGFRRFWKYVLEVRTVAYRGIPDHPTLRGIQLVLLWASLKSKNMSCWFSFWPPSPRSAGPLHAACGTSKRGPRCSNTASQRVAGPGPTSQRPHVGVLLFGNASCDRNGVWRRLRGSNRTHVV